MAENEVLKTCVHCHAAMPTGLGQALFCCRGCEFAYRLIGELGLSAFYSLRTASAARPEVLSTAPALDASFFDAPSFNQRFLSPAHGGRRAEILLPDLSCYACVWLCEQAVSRQIPGATLRVNLADKSGTIELSAAETKLSSVIQTLQNLGYRVLPNSHTEKQKYFRLARNRLGIAILGALNIMSFAAAEYLGLQNAEYLRIFRALQGFLALPVLAYSARPFWTGAWRSLRTRTLGIDLPISVALATAAGFSYANLLRGFGPLYFDSTTGGIALLLLGRLLQDRALQKTEQALRLAADSDLEWSRRLDAEVEVPTPARDLKTGDRIRLLPGDTVPLRARVVAGSGFTSRERLSGEPRPEAVSLGSELHAQEEVLSSPLEALILENGVDAYWTNIDGVISQLRSRKAAWSKRAERFASYFFSGVLLLAVWVLVSFAGSAEGVERALAALLVACPCAFGFAIPLAYASASARSLKYGVAFRSEHAIEALASASTFVFDKTGTLTLGRLNVSSVTTKRPLDATENLVLWTLCHASAHPAAQSVRRWLREIYCPPSGPLPAECHESIGQGVSVGFLGSSWSLGTSATAANSNEPGTSFAKNGEVLASFAFDDEIAPHAEAALATLKRQGAQLFLLTGDGSSAADAVAAQLELAVLGKGISPAGKFEKVSALERKKNVVMIGNGVNDSLALAGASVGISVPNASAAATRAADIALFHGGIEGVVTARNIARHSRGVILSTFAFAATYNVVGLALAVAGIAGPLFAALAMPLASLAMVRISTLPVGEIKK